jgi:hypothetical protein
MRNSLIWIAFVLGGCVVQEKTSFSVKHYDPSDSKIRITGRVASADSVTIYWPATSVKVKFKGSSLKAYLRDEKGANFFNVVIDGDSVHHIDLDSAKRYYTLAENLSEGEHTVELIKRSEWDKGKTWFFGMQVTGGELQELPPANKRIIEFFGNSITVGYAIDDTTGGDSPEGLFTNSYYTYAAITARHFNADYYCTGKSGIGIMVSWFDLTMPQLYDRLDPNDSITKWDFRRATPQLVVINLMQNDRWLINMPEHASFKRKFGAIPPTGSQIVGAYKRFVSSVRSKYPEAQIICALGSMDATVQGSPFPGYVEQAVDQLADKKIYTVFFPYIDKGGHPRRDDNEAMAKQLIDFIETNIRW